MVKKVILTKKSAGIQTITLNRGEKKNAFTEAMYAELNTIFLDLAKDAEINVVILTGGRDFSAGNDLNDFLGSPPGSAEASVFQFMFALRQCPVPVITAVDGFAVGIGSTLLPHCDFVYCTERSQFMLPFVNLCVRPEYGSTQILPLLAGHPKAAELLLLGEKFDAQTAREIGLVNDICSENELMPKCQEVAEKLSKKDRTTLIETKALLRRDIEPLDDRIRHEAGLFLKSVTTPQAKAAISALIRK